MLNLLGAALPADLLGPSVNNPLGHWEPRVAYELHNQLLEEIDTSWDDWTPIAPNWFRSPSAARYAHRLADFLTTEFADRPLFVLKDPRLCRLAPLWLQAFELAEWTPKVVFPVRGPLDVAASLNKRNGMPMGKAMLVWLRYVVDAEAATRGLRRCFVSYDLLLADWRKVVDDIGRQLDLAWPRRSLKAEREIAEFLSPEHRHNYSSETDFERAGTHLWVARVAHALNQLIDDPAAPAAMATLDAVREALDQAAQAFWPVMADELAAAQDRADSARHQVKSERGEALRDVERLNAELQLASGQNDELRAQLDRLKTELASGDEDLRSQLAQSQAAQRDRSDEVQRVLADADELRSRLAESAAQVTHWRGAAVKAAEEIGAKARALVGEAQARAAEVEDRRLEALEELARTRDVVSELKRENEVLAAAEALSTGELAGTKEELRKKHKAVKAERALHESELARLQEENALLASERSASKRRSMELKKEREGLGKRLSQLTAEMRELQVASEAGAVERRAITAQLAEASSKASESEIQRKKLKGQREKLNDRLVELEAEVALLKTERQKLMSSASWRITRPLRQLSALQSRLPANKRDTIK
jgi:hypothetical protein